MDNQESIPPGSEFIDASPDSVNEMRIREVQIYCAVMEKISFASNPIKLTYAQLRVPLYLRVPGCYISAPYGSGKTIAMDFCANALRDEIPGLPVFVINEQVIPGNELRSFFVRALTESKYDGCVTSKADVLRNRLALYWAELSFASPLGCVVLLLDEGQALRTLDEALLKDLSNEISHNHGSIQIFIFGESPALDLLVQKKMGKSDGAADRLFGGQKLNLFGYESVEDWESLFDEMDTHKSSKLGGKTVIEAFFGHMDMSQFVMKKEAKRFFAVLKKLKKTEGSGNYNLRRIFVGIRHALMTSSLISISQGHKSISLISKDQWAESLRYGSQSKL